jgi:hypothetical protein
MGQAYGDSWYFSADPVFASNGVLETSRTTPSLDISPMVTGAVTDVFFARSVHAGELPLWNPHQGLGTPLLAEGHTTILDPLRWILVWLSDEPDTRTSWLAVLHLIMGALSVFLWMRASGISVAVSVAVAMPYTWIGSTLSYFRFPDLPAYMLAPLVMGCFELLLRRARLRDAFMAGAALALVVISSHPMCGALSLLTAGLFVAVRLLTDGLRRTQRKRTLWLVLAAVGTGVALSAPLWVPFLEYVRQSWSYPMDATTLAPDVFSAVSFLRPPHADRQDLAAMLMVCGAAGFVVPGRLRWPSLILVLVGLGYVYNLPPLAFLRGARRATMIFLPRYAHFIIALGAVGLTANFLQNIFHARRIQRRAAAFFCAVVAILVGVTCLGPTAPLWWPASLRTPQPLELPTWIRAGTAFAAGAVGAALVVCIGGRRRARTGTRNLAAIVLYGLALLEVGSKALDPIKPDERFHYDTTPALAFLREGTASGERVVGVGTQDTQRGKVPHIPNLGLVTGLDDVRAVQPLFIGRAHRLLQRTFRCPCFPTWLLLQDVPPPSPRGGELLSLLGVKYVLRRPDAWRGSGPPVYADANLVVERTDAQARAFVVHRARTAVSQDDAFTQLEGLNFADEVVIESADGALAFEGFEHGPEPDVVSWHRPSAMRTVLAVHASGPGYLVLSDAFYPGWRALVDGVEKPVLPADGPCAPCALSGVIAKWSLSTSHCLSVLDALFGSLPRPLGRRSGSCGGAGRSHPQ